MAIPELLTRRQVEAATGFSRAHLYSLVQRGLFPKPLRMSPRVVRWLASEVAGFIETRDRAAGKVAK